MSMSVLTMRRGSTGAQSLVAQKRSRRKGPTGFTVIFEATNTTLGTKGVNSKAEPEKHGERNTVSSHSKLSFAKAIQLVCWHRNFRLLSNSKITELQQLPLPAMRQLIVNPVAQLVDGGLLRQERSDRADGAIRGRRVAGGIDRFAPEQAPLRTPLVLVRMLRRTLPRIVVYVGGLPRMCIPAQNPQRQSPRIKSQHPLR